MIFITEFQFLQIATSVRLTGLIELIDVLFRLRALVFACKCVATLWSVVFWVGTPCLNRSLQTLRKASPPSSRYKC